jgi:hypothetical protein
MTTALGGALTAQKVTVTPTGAEVEVAAAILISISVPGDATIVDVIVDTTDMDTGATLAYDVGEVSGPVTPDPNRFISAFSGQAAAILHANVAGGLLDSSHTYDDNTGSVESVIELTIETVAATGVAGTLSMEVIYYR